MITIDNNDDDDDDDEQLTKCTLLGCSAFRFRRSSHNALLLLAMSPSAASNLEFCDEFSRRSPVPSSPAPI